MTLLSYIINRNVIRCGQYQSLTFRKFTSEKGDDHSSVEWTENFQFRTEGIGRQGR